MLLLTVQLFLYLVSRKYLDFYDYFFSDLSIEIFEKV